MDMGQEMSFHLQRNRVVWQQHLEDLWGNQDKQKSIAQVVKMVGKEPAQFLMTNVKVGIIPGRDSTAGDPRYDKLSNCRDHFGIPEGEKTINSYNDWCCQTYSHALYGT